MTWRVTVTADVESEEEARRLESDMEEAVGKNNGDLQWTEVQDLEADLG